MLRILRVHSWGGGATLKAKSSEDVSASLKQRPKNTSGVKVLYNGNSTTPNITTNSVGDNSDSIEINSTNFPDAHFRNFVSNNFDYDKDGWVSYDTLDQVTTMDVYGAEIRSLKGIEFFTKLQKLDCSMNYLTALDISQNTALTILECYDNTLTQLDVSKNIKLSDLNCSYNQLTQLDVSQNTVLRELDCSGNKLIELDVSKNLALKGLDCSNNKLTQLYFTENINLEEIICHDNPLMRLDLGRDLDPTSSGPLGGDPFAFKALKYTLDSGVYSVNLKDHISDHISKIKAGSVQGKSGGYNIRTTYDSSTGIATFNERPEYIYYTYDMGFYRDAEFHCEVQIEVSAFFPDDAFREFIINHYDVDEFDGKNDGWIRHSELRATRDLSVDNLGITSMKGLELFTQLQNLNCSKNQLTELDVSRLSVLRNLNCGENQLTKLNVSNNTNLYSLGCSNNQLTQLDVSNCSDLTFLYCSDNLLTQLDVSKNEELGELHCNNNRLIQLNNLPSDINIYGGLECGAQQYDGLKYTQDSSFYYVNLKEYLAENVSNVKPESVKGISETETVETEYDSSTGVAKFNVKPEYVYYEYNVPNYDWIVMDVKFFLADTPGEVNALLMDVNFPNGKIGSAYNGTATLTALGNASTSCEWTMTPEIPGLTLTKNSNGATLSGTPTTAGAYKITLTATDSNGISVSKTVTVNIFSDIAISGTFTATGKVRESYKSTVSAVGGTGYKWEQISGTLPPGLRLSWNEDWEDDYFEEGDDIGAKIELSGTPTQVGTFVFTLRAKDVKSGLTAEQEFTVEISSPSGSSLNISGTLPATGKVGEDYEGRLRASGSDGYNWSVVDGKLPDGLELDWEDDEATISGTPTRGGTFAFTLRVTDEYRATTDRSFTVTISLPDISISGTLPSTGTVGEEYEGTLRAYGGEEYSWSVASGNLPDGLRLYDEGDEATLSGTPTKAGEFTFTLRVTDTASGATSEQEFTLTISLPEISISGTLPSTGTVNEEYEGKLRADGGTEYSWEIVNGTLPEGLDINEDEDEITISGTPTESGEFTFTVRVTDSSGATAEQEFTINISGRPGVEINSENFPDDSFREFVNNFATDDDEGWITEERLAEIRVIDVSNSGITSLKGIEFFTNLEGLYCNNNQLTEIDVSQNTALRTLNCSNNNLTQIDVNNNSALSELYCASNQISELDLSENVNLTSLDCSDNNLTELDVGNNVALTNLVCSFNPLGKIDVSQNVNLVSLECVGNQLTELALDENIALEHLDCSRNNLPQLDVSNNVALIGLLCEFNDLVEIDVSENTALVEFGCSSNDLIQLDVSNNDSLKRLWCGDNQLMELDVSNNRALELLACFDNQLTQLDVSNNVALTYLSCHQNRLSALDLSKNTKLETLKFSEQNPKGLKYIVNSGSYYVSLKDSLSDNISNIIPESVVGMIGTDTITTEYNEATGIAKFDEKPDYVYYQYNTGHNNQNMDVSFELADTPEATLSLEVDFPTVVGVNKEYSGTATILGDTEAFYTWSMIPEIPGLSLEADETGQEVTLNGTPTTAGTYYFTLTATDNDTGISMSKECTLTVVEINISGTLPTTGTLGTTYEGSLKVAGGTSYEWEQISGILPTGLTFSPTSESQLVLSGTLEETGTFTFAFRVTDVISGATDEVEITITVTQPVITGTLTKTGVVNRPYSSAITVSGGTSPYTWTYSGTLPNGLELVPDATGSEITLKGTPTTAKKYTFTLTATDNSGATASKKFTVTITKPVISGDITAKGVVKKAYSSAITVSGGTSPYTWTKSSGTLPKGLELIPNSTGSKLTLKGTPTTAKEYTFTLKATDKNGAIASKKFTVTITKPVISGDIKASGIVKKAYSSAITVSGGTSPYTWTKSSGTLPKGLELIPNSTGSKLTLKGTPTTAKEYAFTLKATDKNGATASKKFTVTITKPVISGDITAKGVVKKAYSSAITVSGGTSPYTWKKSSGTLPAGLSLVSNSTGSKVTLKGTPTTAKEYAFTLKVTDKNGATASKAFNVTITKPVISGDVAASGVVKKSYSSSITVSGGTSPYTWAKSSGTLPAGLKLTTNSTGTKLTLKGTPTTAKEYTFTLKVTDKNGATASKAFNVTVTKPIISGNLASTGIVKKSYSSSLTVSKGTSPYTWSKSSGTLPTGLKLTTNSTGTKVTLKGTPTKANEYTFTLKVTDKNGATASKKFTVTITKADTTSKSNSTEAEQTENSAENLTTKDYSGFENVQDVTYDVENDIFSNSYELTELDVLSDDVLWQGTDKDEDLVGVRAGKPVTFVIGEWINLDGSVAEVSDIQIFIDDKFVEDITVSELGTFTIQPEFINGDFKVQAKAKTETSELETEELFISVEE